MSLQDSKEESSKEPSPKEKKKETTKEKKIDIQVTAVKFKGTFDELVKQEITKELAVFNDKIVPSKISARLSGVLNEKFGKGWCVFAGGHFSGSCVFEKNMFAEIEFGNYTIVIFKTYVPSK